MKLPVAILGVVLFCISPWAARAAGPYVVDDADIAEPGTLQNENWISHTNKGETLAVANGAYQIVPDTELSLQGMHEVEHGNHDDTIEPQIKYLWRKGPDDTVRSSLVVGSDYRTDGGSVADIYAYVPASLKVSSVLDVNVNLGVEYEKEADRHVATWGIGTEYHATKTWSVVSEIFGQNTDTPGVQLGPHYVVSKAIELDLVYGHNVFNTSEDVITAGLTVNL